MTTVFALAGAAGTAAMAQSQPDANVVQEVIVTGTKRGETAVQKTAITMNVVSGDALETQHIQDSTDLQKIVPGLVVDTGSSTPRIALRGVSSDAYLVGAESNVSVYVDGIYIGRVQGLLSAYNDLERVEVLKGPQGITFGRNSIGGTINYISRAPTAGQEFSIFAQGGSFNDRRFGGSANIGGDKVAARVAGFYNKDDGYMDNLADGEKILGVEQVGVRGSLRLAPTPDFTATFRLDYSNQSYRGGSGHQIAGPSPVTDSLTPYFGGCVVHTEAKKWDACTNPAYAKTAVLLPSLTLSAQVGPVTLNSITAYGKTDYHLLGDADASSVDFLWDTWDVKAKQISEEVQALTDVGRFSLLGGAYFYRETADSHTYINFAADINPMAGAQVNWLTRQVTKSVAVFSDVRFAITDTIKLEGGVRYTKDQKSLDTLQLLKIFGIPEFPTCDLRASDSWSKVTWLGSIEDQVNENLFVFGKASSGFKSGGFTDGSCIHSYRPESLTAFEGGFKSRLMDRHVTLNVSVFHYDYNDLQVSVIRGVAGGVTSSQIENAATAKITGVDFQGQANLPHGFTFDAGFSWLAQADYGDYHSLDPFVPFDPTKPEKDQLVNLSGRNLNRAPEFSGLVGLEYAMPLGSNWNARLRGEGYFTSEIAFTPFYVERPQNIQPHYEVANFFLTFERDDHPNYQFQVFVKNAFNAFYATDLTENTAIIATFAEIGRPREFGVRVAGKF